MNDIVIYKDKNKVQVEVAYEKETFWLSLNQIAELFERDKSVISRHIKNIFETKELSRRSTVAKKATVQREGKREITRNIEYYNLDLILSVGYRVNSVKGTQFRIWATSRLKEYLVRGYAINERRLMQKKQELETLKTGIRILNRSIEAQTDKTDREILSVFSKGLDLLDDYDHEQLDSEGQTISETEYPTLNEYLDLIKKMNSDFQSAVFAKPKDRSFESSINQIKQSFNGKELYPTLEEKAANLLYFITKNHSFVDGNKRIAAACFLLFLQRNNVLQGDKEQEIISNEALASLTLFIASSKTNEADVVKRFVVSILNRNKI